VSGSHTLLRKKKYFPLTKDNWSRAKKDIFSQHSIQLKDKVLLTDIVTHPQSRLFRCFLIGLFLEEFLGDATLELVRSYARVKEHIPDGVCERHGGSVCDSCEMAKSSLLRWHTHYLSYQETHLMA